MASIQPYSGILGTRLAAHLLRRATFRATRARIDQFATLTPQQAIDELYIIQPPTLSEPIDPLTGQPWVNSGIEPMSANQQLRNYVKSWWLDEARQDNSIGSKMQFFLHNCYTAAAVTLGADHFYDYLALLRYYALGNFKILSGKVTFDNLMLKYLDNAENNKNNPNQNYAREFLELFSIGKGAQISAGNYTNYTEDDIIQAARVLTGIKEGDRTVDIDPETNIPHGRIVSNQHDTGNKTFSAAFQNTIIEGGSTTTQIATELYAFINMIFDQAETARYACRRLYRYFVSKNITAEIESDIIEPLAATLRDNNYELAPTVRQLLTSQHFYDLDDSDNSDEIIGSLVKSPLELVLGSMTYFDIAVPSPTTLPQLHYQLFYARGMIQTMFNRAGFDPFAPPDVAGYPAYYQTPDYNRAWFNSSTIITRYKLPEMWLTGTRVLAAGELGVQLHIVNFVQNPDHISNPSDAYVLVSEMMRYMLPEMPENDRAIYFFDLFLNGLPPDDWTYEWDNYVLTGNEDEVRIPLENLVKALMFSPEYQLF